MKTYGFDRVKLYQNYSIEELEELKRIVIEQHKGDIPKPGMVVSERCWKKIDAIGWAIYYHAKDQNPTNGAMRISVDGRKNW